MKIYLQKCNREWGNCNAPVIWYNVASERFLNPMLFQWSSQKTTKISLSNEHVVMLSMIYNLFHTGTRNWLKYRQHAKNSMPYTEVTAAVDLLHLKQWVLLFTTTSTPVSFKNRTCNVHVVQSTMNSQSEKITQTRIHSNTQNHASVLLQAPAELIPQMPDFGQRTG